MCEELHARGDTYSFNTTDYPDYLLTVETYLGMLHIEKTKWYGIGRTGAIPEPYANWHVGMDSTLDFSVLDSE